MKPTNAEFSKIFDSAAAKYDKVSNSYSVKRRIEFFVHHAKGDCLEVGAGTGEISRALLAAGHTAIATDISPNMVKEMQSKGIDARVSDAEQLPFPDASFDTVVGAEMIYYLEHPDVFIGEASRVLRPGGRLLLSSANNTTKIYDRLRALLRTFGLGSMYFDDKNREFITAKKLRALLEKGGFEVEKIEKIIVIPFGFLDFLNRILEKTPLKHFGIFILAKAKKKA